MVNNVGQSCSRSLEIWPVHTDSNRFQPVSVCEGEMQTQANIIRMGLLRKCMQKYLSFALFV